MIQRVAWFLLRKKERITVFIASIPQKQQGFIANLLKPDFYLVNIINPNDLLTDLIRFQSA